MENVCPLVDQTQEEIWKPVVGFEGIYEVSTFGRVKSIKRKVRSHTVSGFRTVSERFLKQCLNAYGYYMLGLCGVNKRKNMLVHRLVGYAFLGLTDNLQIDHIDGVKTNNHIENLRVVTHSGNMRGHRGSYGKSKFRGVSRTLSKTNPWIAVIKSDSRPVYLGLFPTEEAAARAWNEKAIELGYSPTALNVV